MNVISLTNALDHKHIEHRESAKALQICCPFCNSQSTGKHDEEFHLGIFIDNFRWFCWRCRRAGSLAQLAKALNLNLELSATEVRDGLTAAEEIKLRLFGEPKTVVPPVVEALPNGWSLDDCSMKTYPELAAFFTRRRIHPNQAVNYDAFYGGRAGAWAYRLILPCYEDGKLVLFQGRDVTGKLQPRYLTSGPVGEHIYLVSWRTVSQPLYVVEGVFDAWRMESGAIGTFKHGMSQRQRQLILDIAKATESPVVFAWDGDSTDMNEAAAKAISPICKAGWVALPKGLDPDALGADGVRNLKIRWA